MTSEFIDNRKKLPPDEPIERDAPRCPDCGHQMSVLRIVTQLSDSGTRSKHEYECLQCGRKLRTESASEKIKPLAAI